MDRPEDQDGELTELEWLWGYLIAYLARMQLSNQFEGELRRIGIVLEARGLVAIETTEKADSSCARGAASPALWPGSLNTGTFFGR